MTKCTVNYRLYADGNVVHEDEFEVYDSAMPYYDDYEVFTIPHSGTIPEDLPPEIVAYLGEYL